MRYHDWHGEPGYWRDVTRHFDPDALLLDLGCGSAWLGAHFPRYLGVDDHPDAFRDGGGRVARVARGSVAHLPLRDSCVDAVVCKDVLEHVPDPRVVVREVARVLRPGGLVYVSVPDAQRWVWEDYTHVRPYPRRALRRLLADEGLTVVRLGHESVTPGVGVVSRLSPWHRRPWPYRLLARTRLARRNVWALARLP